MYASYSKENKKIHQSAVLNHGIIATLIICTYMQVCTSRVTYLEAKMVIMVRENYFTCSYDARYMAHKPKLVIKPSW